ncbi:G-protein coupled receptor family C group 6 member A Precursor [Larimichthys crocea]|uniref:G-protein coupled receptor family C group 6 member A n=1 Tax=Larimichthys crocea TaxID=215358 RepID=A0A6G0I7K1_LARCR|nr:G-protein coupled receptor family C group 6 member A Precursor [Larimichthys crocea]
MLKRCLLSRLLSALIILSSIPAHVDGHESAQCICGAHSPGDVEIGIMLPCHRKVTALHARITPESFHCSDFDLESFVKSLAVIHEIEEINAARFLPGVRLGYMMCDTCSYASKALQNVGHMLAVNMSLNVKCDYTDFRPRVKIIVGALYSEVSIAVARLLNVYMVTRNALKNLLKCDNSSCLGEINFQPWKLLKELKKVKFKLDDQTFFFDDHDLHDCKMCPNGTWSGKGWSQCKPRELSYLKWSDPHPITMMSAAAFGVLLLLAIFVIFMVYRNSPPMKRAERQTGRVGDMAKVKKRKASPIWDYFQYSSETDRSVCMVGGWEGECIARCIDETMVAWDIVGDKVLLVVTDNGSNIVKAVRLLSERPRQEIEPSAHSTRLPPGDGLDDVSWEEEEPESESDEENGDISESGDFELVLPDDGKFQRMPCLAHTLQLSLKDAMKHPSTDLLLTRARKLIRTELNQVLEELGMDTLLTSDWSKMENLVTLLEPFAIHTDQLQSDSQSLSQVVPCLLNLEAHLQTTTVAAKPLAQTLLKSLRERFAGILSPASLQFDATPAAACLLDPNVSVVLLTPDMLPLKMAALSFIQNMMEAQYNQCNPPTTPQDVRNEAETPSANAIFQKYRFLATRMEVNVLFQNGPEYGSLMAELRRYEDEIKSGVSDETPLKFWQSREAVYPKLSPLALDLVSAPASQAFVERIFSLCGLLSSGLRNRATTSLEQRVFLKINKDLLM